MAVSHIILQGEHLARIASQYSFRDYRLIWDHPRNSELKKQRVNPNVLNPGDVLYIPDKQQKTENRPTTLVHKFVVSTPKLMLRLVVRDFDNQAVANADCELQIGTAQYFLKTDAEGRIEKPISASEEDGVLRIPSLDIQLPVKIGHLDPSDEEFGWRQRLINLGYHAEPLDDEDDRKLRQAVEEFQCDQKIGVTGELDDATRACLKDAHGC